MKKQPLYINRVQGQKIHDATLKVLEKTGIALDHPETERMLLRRGAKKDSDGRILIHGELVQEALDRIPHRFTLYDRDGKKAFQVEDGPSYFGTGSDSLYQIDLESGEIRESTMQDVADNMRLCDALDYDFVMSTALPKEVPSSRLYPAVFAQMMKNTHKPIVTTCVDVNDVRHIHELALIVCGGKENFKPFFIAYLEPLSPLIFDRELVQKILYCAENGIPFICASGSNLGTGSPVTLEGALIQGGAESLAGLVIAYLKNKNLKFIYGANNSASDMRSGRVCYGPTEWPKTVSMYADMGKYYDLPSWGTAGGTDAQNVNAQAGWEAYRSISTVLRSGSTIVHNMGYMSFGELYDPRMILLANEMLKDARHLVKPVTLDDNSMAMDVIDQVAREKSIFLAHPHTAKNFRQSLMISKLINRKKIGEEFKDISQKLKDGVKKILKTHRPKTLPEDVTARIDEYIAGIDPTTKV